MSICESNVVDAIAYDDANSTLIMLLSDHLSWENEYEHLMALQTKLNSYAAFIESGQHLGINLNGKIDRIVIQAHFLHGTTDNCRKFIDIANKHLAELNMSIEANAHN